MYEMLFNYCKFTRAYSNIYQTYYSELKHFNITYAKLKFTVSSNEQLNWL